MALSSYIVSKFKYFKLPVSFFSDVEFMSEVESGCFIKLLLSYINLVKKTGYSNHTESKLLDKFINSENIEIYKKFIGLYFCEEVLEDGHKTYIHYEILEQIEKFITHVKENY